MTIDRIFYIFIVLAGIAAGAVLVAWPAAASFAIKPYFWILFAMAGFEAVAFLIGRGAPGTMLNNLTRLIGLALGIGLMAGIAWLAGTQVQFL
jgi:hypothetical protein